MEFLLFQNTKTPLFNLICYYIFFTWILSFIKFTTDISIIERFALVSIVIVSSFMFYNKYLVNYSEKLYFYFFPEQFDINILSDKIKKYLDHNELDQTNQTNQSDELNQTNQTNQINQPNQINQTNQSDKLVDESD